MTTPNQPLPDTVETLLGTGAYEVGGAGTKFGQGIDATAVTSAFALDKPTQDNKVEVFQQALQMLPTEALSSFQAVIPDWAEGDETDSVVVADKLFGNLFDRPTVQQTWDDIANFFFGWTGVGRTRPESQQAIAEQAATTADLVATITALLNQQAAQGNSGNSAVVDFSARANSSSLGSDFPQTYSGLGTDFLWGIVDGKATVYDVTGDLTGSDNDPRACIAPYNAKQTLTDYQMVGAAFASSPQVGGGVADDGENLILGRCNAAGTSFVYARLLKYTWELGCVVSGTKTVFATDSYNFKSTGNYWLQCGDVGGVRVFKIFDGSNPIVTHTEVGTTSQLGASYRYTGIGELTWASPFGANYPGRMTAFAFADNTPPSFLGSGALMYRTSATGIGLSPGQNQLPFNFFGAVGDNTSDINVNISTGRFTASIEGWYTVSARLRTTGLNWPDGVQLLLFKGSGAGASAPYRYGGPEFSRMSNVFGGARIPLGIYGTWTNVYLRPGDYVELGYDASGLSGSAITGEASGLQTFFSITLANKSLA